MIHIDKENLKIDGNINTLMSEVALAMHAVIEQAAKNDRRSYSELMGELQRSARLYKLTDSGMKVEDAMEIIGMDPRRLNKRESVIPDELTAESK